jgi:hypothetical protein
MSRSSNDAPSDKQILDSLVWITDTYAGDPIKRLVAVLESGRKVPLPVACPPMLGPLRESQEKVRRYLQGRREGMTARAIMDGMLADGDELSLSAVEKALRRLKALGMVKNTDGEWFAVDE